MINALLLQANQLTDVQRAIRDRFQEGGSVKTVLLVMLALIAMVYTAYFLATRQQKGTGTTEPDPQRLFRDLQGRLELTHHERHLLDRVAKDLRLKHPAVILLCPALFDRYLHEWHARDGEGTPNTGDRPLAGPDSQLRRTLFPDA